MLWRNLKARLKVKSCGHYIRIPFCIVRLWGWLEAKRARKVLVNGWTIVDGWRIAARRETYIHHCHIKSNGDGPPARHWTLALTLGGNHHASLTIVRLERYSESSNDGQSLSLLGFVPRRLRLATFHGLRQMLGNQRRQEGIPLGQLVEGGFSAADGAGYLIRRGAGGLRQA